MKRRGLGRGLEALLPSAPDSEGSPDIPVDRLDPNPDQPRGARNEPELESLAASIGARGILEPIVVRPVGDRFQIVAGERRWRAARLAGLARVPVVVRDVPDEDLGLLALVENLQREDLNPLEEAIAFRRLVSEHGRTHEQIAREVGRSRAAVTNALRLLDLDPEVRELIGSRRLRAASGRAMVPLAAAEQRRLAREVVQRQLSVRDVERRVKAISGGRPGGGKSPPRLDPNSLEAQDRMQAVLGLPVEIRRQAKGGQLRVRFFTEDDLQRLFERLTAR